MEVYEFPSPPFEVVKLGEQRDRDSTKPTYGLE